MSKALNNIRKLSDIISVRDYGALGDGVTDDAAAIQAAITASQGRRIVFPAGVFRVASTLTLQGNTYIEGHGTGSTTIKLANGINANLIQGTSLSYVSITDMTLDGNNANQTVGAVARALYLLDCKKVYLERLRVKNAADHGAFMSIGPTTDPLSDSSEIWVDKCIFEANGTTFAGGNGGSGLAVVGTRLWARDSYAFGNLLAGFKFTGKYVTASGLHAEGNFAGGFTTGFDSVTEEGSYQEYIGCRAIGNGYAGDPTKGGDGFRHQGQVDKIIHRDCISTGNYWSGVCLLASSTDKPTNIDIFGGEYNNNGQNFTPSSTVSGSGISILSTVPTPDVPSVVRLNGVTATDTQAGKTQLYGVEVQQGDNIYIGEGCSLTGNKTSSIYNLASVVTNMHLSPQIIDADFIVRSVTPVSHTGDLVETDLQTITIPANTFNKGQRFRLRARGTVVGTAGTKQFRLYVGNANSLMSSQSAAEVQEWSIDAVLDVAGTSSIKTSATCIEIAGQTSNAMLSSSTALSSAITIKVTGTLGAAGDTVTCSSFFVEPIY